MKYSIANQETCWNTDPRKNNMKKLVIMLNILGIACLSWFFVKYAAHDTYVANPNAMLPMEGWEAAGMILTLGFLPLLGANAMAYAMLGSKDMKAKRLLFFIPSIICLCTDIHYWATSLMNDTDPIPSKPIVLVQLSNIDQSTTQCGIIYDDGGMEILDSCVMNAYEDTLEPDDTTQHIQDICKDDQDIKIFHAGEEYFIQIHSDNYDFYRYDKDTDTFQLLYYWEDQHVTNISLP